MTWDKTIGTAQDYSTIALWIASIPDVDAGSKQPVFGRMTDEDFNEMNQTINVVNWTPDLSNFIILLPQGSTSFDGKPGNGPRVFGNGAFGDILQIDDIYTTIKNIEVENSGSNGVAIRGQGGGGIIEGCICKSASTAITLLNDDKAINNLCYDSVNGISLGNFSSNMKALNNTVHNCSGIGINIIGSTGSNSQVDNNIVFDCGTDQSLGTPGRLSSNAYNASDDGFGTNAISPSGADWANEFTDYTNDDFSILNSGNVYLGSELTQADDADIPADDTIGTARNTGVGEQTSVGCFEFLAQGGLLPIYFNQQKRVSHTNIRR